MSKEAAIFYKCLANLLSEGRPPTLLLWHGWDAKLALSWSNRQQCVSEEIVLPHQWDAVTTSNWPRQRASLTVDFN
jgi:hypothetical protein